MRIAAIAILMALADASPLGAQDPGAQATQQASQDAAMAAQGAQQQPSASASTGAQPESRLPHREERAIANARQFEEGTRAAQFKQTGPPAGAPVFSLKPGSYTGSQTVEITNETPSSVIYFTLDDTTPVESWLRYTQPITLVNTSTLRAVAVASMHSASSVSTATYTLSSPSSAPSSPTPH